MLIYISENIKKYISNLILIIAYKMMFVKKEEDYDQFNEQNQKLKKEKGKSFTVYHLLKRFSGIMPSLLEMFI